MLGKTKKLHLIGIGGAGMSGIAELLINYGFQITGSDLRQTNITEKLEKMGAKISYKHETKHITDDVDVVVKSSAIEGDNVEVRAAQKKKIPVIRRAEMLSELMRMKFGISIAGTHGKTTSTSMVGMILQAAQLQPTLIIGGIVKNFDSNAVLGDSDYIVVEADEFDRSFLSLSPIIAGITNIEEEHVDCYADTQELETAFLQFANSVPFFGLIVACVDDPKVKHLIPRFKRRYCTYGINSKAEVRAKNIKFKNFNSEYDLIYKGERLGTIELQLPGLHNIKNSLLAATIALELDIPFIDIRNGLLRFSGVYRRFEKKAFINDILVYDDYAHHPSEIKATLTAIRAASARRVITIFQPHLYSRTQLFYKEFAHSLKESDVVIINDIYPAREEPIAGVSGKLIYDELKKEGHKNIKFIKKKENIPDYLFKIIKSGDLVITMGAGDVFEAGEQFIELLRENVEK
ncbi:MAG: UDP-N-acetylmuramate--L-alanine ligase [Candidatus Cloacimonetes bacterium]|nr:UDP-N-acetylmuramate--L-alanine ligase [Candidatus Cloacimonadota bacterium]